MSRRKYEETLATAHVYQLLARLWLREVNSGLVRELSHGQLAKAFASVGGQLPDGPVEDVVEELAIDYCQLFLGPSNHLPPYQSVWTRGQFQAAPAESMTHFIELIGHTDDRWGVMPDHLGVQLDVMHVILASHDAVDAATVGEIARAFFFAHLDWTEPLLDAARQRAQSEFYRSLVDMTHEFLLLQRGSNQPTEQL